MSEQENVPEWAKQWPEEIEVSTNVPRHVYVLLFALATQRDISVSEVVRECCEGEYELRTKGSTQLPRYPKGFQYRPKEIPRP